MEVNKKIAQQSTNFIGEGQPLFRKNFTGPELAGIMTRSLDSDYVCNAIQQALSDAGFDPTKQYTPDQGKQFETLVRTALMSKFADYVQILNPQLADIKL